MCGVCVLLAVFPEMLHVNGRYRAGNEAITSMGVLISQAVNSPGRGLLDWWRTVISISISFSAGSHA